MWDIFDLTKFCLRMWEIFDLTEFCFRMWDIFDLTKFREDHKLELVGMNLFKSQNDPFVRYFYIEHQNKTEEPSK